jgi:Asp-tRNA(Asn)/Glu-tRNA(Gln) amidotransferase A subunit family amidase
MVDVALGTQTAGSVIRPASFCGILGYKPTFGAVNVSGVKPVAPSLDTVGWFAREVALLDRVRTVLAGAPVALPPDTAAAGAAPTIACPVDDLHDAVDADAHGAVTEALARARRAGAVVSEIAFPPTLRRIGDDVPAIMAWEAARSLAWEHGTHPDRLSTTLRALLDRGAAIPYEEVCRARARAVTAGRQLGRALGTVDVLLVPAATGEAPAGLGSTGDPRCARAWTLLGCPSVSVPGLTGASGLPVGVQLVARRGDDATLLRAAAWLARRLPTPAAPGAGRSG